MNEHWTTDPPEVGKRYWICYEAGDGTWFDACPTRFDRLDVSFWRTRPSDRRLRSVHPIPDPQPPPLPSGDEKERE